MGYNELAHNFGLERCSRLEGNDRFDSRWKPDILYRSVETLLCETSQACLQAGNFLRNAQIDTQDGVDVLQSARDVHQGQD